MLAHRRLAFAALALLSAAPTHLAAQQQSADSAALVTISQRLMDAITNGDSSVWAAQLSARWFITDEEGRHIGRAEFLEQLRGLPPGQSGKLEVRNAHFTTAPGVAVLSYDIDEWHDFHGQMLRTRFHTTDTWVKEGGAWKMLASQITALPTPMPGRPVARRVLDDYAGMYVLTPDIQLRITATDTGLMLLRGTRPAERLHAIDDRIFIRHGIRGFWLFERDASGVVIRLVNWRDNNPVVWRRSKAP